MPLYLNRKRAGIISRDDKGSSPFKGKIRQLMMISSSYGLIAMEVAYIVNWWRGGYESADLVNKGRIQNAARITPMVYSPMQIQRWPFVLG